MAQNGNAAAEPTGLEGGWHQARAVEEIHVVVSDLHMSEGIRQPVVYHPNRWARRTWERFKVALFGHGRHPLINPVNPLEDFPDDGVFTAFLDKVAAHYGNAGLLVLRLLGDTFDSLAVTWRGDFVEPPYEVVAAAKMKKIIAGHPGFFDAVAAFISRPNVRVDFFVGNHDLFLVWPAVQRLIVRRLTGGDQGLAGRIRFIDHRRNFEDSHRGVVYVHGMEAEAQNHVPARQAIIRHHFEILPRPRPTPRRERRRPPVRKLKRPILNMPSGSLFYVGVINRIKLHNPLVGRLVNYRDLLANAALHRWGWALYTVVALVANFLYHSFFGLWIVRRKMSLSRTFRTAMEAVTCDTVDRHALKLLRDRASARVVIMGHSHEWRRVSSPHGTYINTGTWSLMFGLEYPRFELRWGRWRWAELAWRAFVHFLRTRELRLVAEITLLLFGLMALTGLVALLHWQSWLAFAIVAAAYLLLTGLVRRFAVRPTVVPRHRYTFAVVKHFAGGGLRVDLKEFRPAEDDIRDCV